MGIIHAIILGLVEGVTEFLPISSTGHLVLAAEWLRLPETEFLKSFQIVIQLGAILSVLFLYARRLVTDTRILPKIIAAFLPTAAAGALFYPMVKQWLGSPALVAAMLFVGGVAIILFERWYRSRRRSGSTLEELSFRQAFYIGCFQALAIVPGVSRAGATILGGLSLGLERKAIVEFSFLLALPTMLAASTLDLYKQGSGFAGGEWQLLSIGFVTAFVSALAAVRWLVRYVERHDFTAFGVYRIIVAVLFFLFIIG